MGSIITGIVAVYGAVLATLNYLARRREQKPKIRVWLEVALKRHGDTVRPSLILHAANVGNRTVTLSGYSLKGLGGQELTGHWRTPGTFSRELTPGKGWEETMQEAAVVGWAQALRISGRIRVWGEVTDQTDKTYKSKPIKLDLSRSNWRWM